MRVSNINNTNFKGLWAFGKMGPGYPIKPMVNTFIREVTYHPFSDETDEEIEQTMENAKQHSTHTEFNSNCYSQSFYITNPILGKKLNMTKNEYRKLIGE